MRTGKKLTKPHILSSSNSIEWVTISTRNSGKESLMLQGLCSLMQKKGYIQRKLHNGKKKNRENAPGPYGQRTSSIPGTLVATLRPAAQRSATRRQLRGATRLQKSSRVSYPIAGRGLLCLGSPAAPGIAVSNVLPVTFSRQFRHKKTPCASTAQGVFS